MWMGLNAYNKSMVFELPKPISEWKQLLNTANSNSNNLISISPSKKISQDKIELTSKSLILLLSSQYASKIKL